MTAYRVESAALARIVTELDALTGYANQLIAEIQQLAQGVSAEWTGQANQQYLAAQAEWAEGAARMSRALAALHARSGLAAQNYAAAAEYATEIWG